MDSKTKAELAKEKKETPEIIIEESDVKPEETPETVGEETDKEPEETGHTGTDQDPEVDENIGVVTDCLLLAVREHPTKASPMIATASVNSEVFVSLKKSTKEFYHVVTQDGVTGFCMKSFVKIK